MTFHHGDVKGAAGWKQRAALRDLAGPQNVRLLDSENLVNDVQDHLERRSDSFSLVDGRVATQNLLQDFRVGNQALPRGDQAFQQDLRFRLVQMGRADQLHRDVGIDEDQAW